MKEEITILTKEQVENLDILKKYGTKAEATDFYMMQEGHAANGIGEYWTKTPQPDDACKVFYVRSFGNISYYYAPAFSRGVRPVIPLTKVYKLREGLTKILFTGVERFKYGEYPQSVVDEELEGNLENLYQICRLQQTKKSYISMLNEEKEKYQEFVYKNNKYVRVKASLGHPNLRKFANGREAINGKIYWLKVEPIWWLVDKKENIAIAKNVLAGMPFAYKKDNDYERSAIKVFLNNYFMKEIEENKKIDIDKIDRLVDLMFNTYRQKESKVKQKNKVLGNK